MELNYIYFIYGLCCMFYLMMAWLFLRKKDNRPAGFVAALMVIIEIGCVKDLFFLSEPVYKIRHLWTVMTALDMVAVPLYVFVLKELCRPGSVTRKTVFWQIAPFVVLPALYIITSLSLFYIIEVVWAAAYGLFYAVWTIFAIPRYNRLLKQQFSYEENINLEWLKSILAFFFLILSLWILDSVFISIDIEAVYLVAAMVQWMFLGYFIYRHETVIGELRAPEEITDDHLSEESQMSINIRKLFDEEKVFLNPNLKLADVAAKVGSNRTYVSRFFNSEQNTTFFDFVNGYRVAYAEELLKTSDEKIEIIAEKSGFNSRQAFHRVFSKIKGETPEKFRCRIAKD